MKIKKILSLAITLMMVLSAASIPAMAAEFPTGAYEAGIESDLTDYTYESFTADFKAADYTAFEDFETVPSEYTPVNVYLENSGGHSAMYPFDMAVSGVENGSFSLKLKNTATNGLFVFTEGNENIGNLSSGSYAILAGYKGETAANIVFAAGDTDDDGNTYNVMKVDGAEQADYKITAIGFALKYGSRKQAMNLVVTYENGSTETVSTKTPEGRDKSHFCGVKAPAGQYITALTIEPQEKASFIIDDLGIIFDKPVDAGTVAIGDIGATIAEPQYNAAKQIQLTATVKDASGAEIDEPVVWSVDTTAGGGSRTKIDENGLLTIKRYRDTSIAGTLKVTATCGGASDTKEIEITETPAYYGACGLYNATEYTKDAFLADLANAERKAIANFENDSHTVSNYKPLTTVIKTTGSATPENGEEITVKWQAYQNDAPDTGNRIVDGINNNYPNTIRLESSNPANNRYHELTVTPKEDLGVSKLTAVGMMIGNNGTDLNAIFSIYLNGSETPITYTGLGSVAQTGVDAGPGFYGYKAPAGRYIEKIRFNANGASYLDDLGFIFSEPGEVPAITLSTDAAAGKIISKLADVTGDVYVNIAENAFSGKKILLALYGGNELLDVAIANEGALQAQAELPAGKTLTKIKTFVWDFAGGLIPVQEPIEINK